MNGTTFDLFCAYALLFFVFSVLGWCTEVVCKLVQYGRFINRGFLIGPYCPIYGSGVVLISFVIDRLLGVNQNVAHIFLCSVLICGMLEYFISWLMEAMYHARWWDYNKKPLNINGRVWAGNLCLFGLAGVFIVKLVDPVFFGFVSATFSPRLLHITAGFFIAVLAADAVSSLFIMNLVKKTIDSSEADDTEVIAAQVRALLHDRPALQRRISEAYPEFIARPQHLLDRIKLEKKRAAERKAELKLRVKAEKAALKLRVKAEKEALKRSIADMKADAARASEYDPRRNI